MQMNTSRKHFMNKNKDSCSHSRKRINPLKSTKWTIENGNDCPYGDDEKKKQVSGLQCRYMNTRYYIQMTIIIRPFPQFHALWIAVPTNAMLFL